jgi:hypothetical protein
MSQAPLRKRRSHKFNLLQKKGTGNREQGTGNREQIRNKSCTSLKLSQKKDVF